MRIVTAVATACLLAAAASAEDTCLPSAGIPPCFVTDQQAPTTYPPPPADSQPLRLHHVTLFSPDHERLARWYRDMLGFEIAGQVRTRRSDGVEVEIIRLRMGGLWLNVSRVPDLARREQGREYAGWRHLAFGTGDVQRAWESLRERGANVVGTGRLVFDPPGFAAAFVRDPDGNLIEFYADLRPPTF